MAFQPENLNYELSPYTGLTREDWMEAGEYLLTGIFEHLPSYDAPMVAPRSEWEVSYPRPDDPRCRIQAEYFEGLARSFLIASMLLHNDPKLCIAGYSLQAYYKKQILRACTPGDPNYVGNYEDARATLKKIEKSPFQTVQQTVECCALVIGLWACREVIWDTYTKEEKDLIADFLSGYAHGMTLAHNWRLFNMLMLAFLHMEGYPVDEELMLDHAETILGYYVGDGWYRDGHAFDYYSCWAFQLYAPIWNVWYGYEHTPELAARFEQNSNRLMESYANFFDKNGHTNMWGRSGIYRNGSTCSFAANMLLKKSVANPGLARRICSGSLMQFLGREDLLCKGMPSLGFYGQFAPMVQTYSCAESPLWMGKAFICLYLPKEHPFWTAKEENGDWNTEPSKTVREQVVDGPGFCVTNHEANGGTILRTGKVMRAQNDLNGIWSYGKVCYHSQYPWESTPVETTSVANEERCVERGDVESQQYTIIDGTSGAYKKANATLWSGVKEDVLYRKQYFGFTDTKKLYAINSMNLADFAVPYGLIRVDQMNIYRRPATLTLGSFGFPDNGTIVREAESVYGDGKRAKAIILKGYDFSGNKKQMAMTIYDGWEGLELVHSKGSNADSEKSILVYAHLNRQKQYGHEAYVVVSQVITREDFTDFTEEELFPIDRIEYVDGNAHGGYGPVRVVLKSGDVKVINFDGIEGCLML